MQGDAMAEDPFLESRRHTWRGFIRLIQFSLTAIILALVLMAIFLL